MYKGFFEKFKGLFDLDDDYEIRRIPFRKQLTFTYAQALNVDPTKYFMRTCYDEFVVTILRLLEPLYLEDGQVIQREDQSAINEAVFVTNGAL